MNYNTIPSTSTNTTDDDAHSPLFSIVTVVFNAVDTIRETVESVLNQTWADYEYIVIDGGSTDGTIDILRSYQAQLNYFVSEQDNGIYHAMNKALALCSGEYVFYLNADDYLLDRKALENVASIFRNQHCVVLCCNVRVLYQTYSVIRDTPLDAWLLRRKKAPPHQGFFAKTSLMQELGGFDTGYRSAADFDLFCRISFASLPSDQVQTADLTVAVMRAGGASSHKAVAYLEDTQILRKHFGVAWAVWFYLRKRVVEQKTKQMLLWLGLRSIADSFAKISIEIHNR